MESTLPHQSTTSIAMIFAFTILLYYLSSLIIARSSRRNNREGDKITPAPQAGGTWPFIGHLHLLRGPEPAHRVLGKMADEYGPIFAIKVGVHRALIVSTWEVAKECLTIHDRIFASRPKSIASEVIGYNHAMLGLGPYGPYWRYVRKITTQELLSSQHIESLKKLRESEVQGSVNRLYKQWENHRGSGQSRKVLVDMSRWFGDITLNVAMRMIVGKGAWTTDDEEQDKKLQKAFREMTELIGKFIMSDALPSLRWLDLDGYERRMKKTARELDLVVQGWLDEHKLRRKAGDQVNKDKDRDFMDVMLSIVGAAEELHGYSADTVIKASCMILVAAASDAITVTLIWALSLLLNHREALEKVQDELDTHIGKGRQVKESDLKNLVYVQAILKETLRLYPAGPLAVPHESMEDCTVNGYHIPRGTHLYFNIWKIQRDPRVWSDPFEFRPERFLTTHKDFDLRGQNFELMPFGSGRRMCPGVSLALQLSALSLASFLHGFEVVTPTSESIDMTETLGIISIKTTPLEVLAAPRLPDHLYQ